MFCLVSKVSDQRFSHFGQHFVWSALSSSAGKNQRFSQTPPPESIISSAESSENHVARFKSLVRSRDKSLQALALVNECPMMYH